MFHEFALSSLPRGHGNLLCIIPILAYVLPKWALSLLFNMLSRLVITFLPRSKHLLISWLQSPSAVTLEPPKIKSATVSPCICHEVMGPDAMILVFWCWAFKPTFSLFSFTYIKRLFSSSSLSVLCWFLPNFNVGKTEFYNVESVPFFNCHYFSCILNHYLSEKNWFSLFSSWQHLWRFQKLVWCLGFVLLLLLYTTK